MTNGVTIRHEFRPGDIGQIVFMHGTTYAREFGWDHTFEAYVAAPLGEFAKRKNPRERVWLVDHGDELSASIAIVEASASEAQLRWLFLKPELRGHGLGRRLVSEAVNFSRDTGYSSIFLWTVKELPIASALYVSAGFRLTEETPRDLWGGHVTEQRYDLRF
jgi:GNAT superfamily N-acetyltransferase